jgi:cobalt-zinc-cadmium efflux system protein
MAQKVSSPSAIPRKIAIVLGLTAAFTVVEIAGSLLSNSLTLLADASHMGTDVAALALALLGARIAQRREGAARHFGNLRWEVLAAMMNGLALFVIGILITVEAIDRFGHPRVINAALFGGVAAAGLVVNLVSLRVLHGHHEENLNARGAYLHILGDVLGSVGAIVGAVVIHYTGWARVDPIISVLVSVLILRSAWRLVQTSGLILLDRVPANLQPVRVEQEMMAVDGVTRVHDLHVWTVTSGLIAMSAHVVVPALETHPAVLRRLEHAMSHIGIRHVTIQLETGDECVGELCGDDDSSADTLMLEHGHAHGHAHGHSH